MSPIESSRIGYRRPPTNSQFKKGRSGNPKGRPRGSRNFAAIVAKLMNERIPVTINNQRVLLTRRQALAIQAVNRAVAGDMRFINILRRNEYFKEQKRPLIVWMPESDKLL